MTSVSKKQQTVCVGMSGGVDSSVAAALLKEQGYRVIGAFMKNWSDTRDPVTGRCGWREERHDAERVAARLGIDFLTFDFEREYRDSVVEYLFREYEAGRTPNPDVLCNSAVKFNLFLKEARRLGADFMATGHYCRVREDGGRFELLAGLDRNKDQSYFLHRITQAQLRRTLFPIGHLAKPKVRELARKFRLPVAEKKDSQGICFIGQVKMRDFLARGMKPRPGVIVDIHGNEIGRHPSLNHYTIGQRHGLGLGGGPWFVVGKDVGTGRLVVAHERDERVALYSRGLTFTGAHWISGETPDLPLRCRSRIRYRQPLQAVTVSRLSERGPWQATFARRQRAVTPGQFAVFYDGEVCLGGGTISRKVDDSI